MYRMYRKIDLLLKLTFALLAIMDPIPYMYLLAEQIKLMFP